MGVVRCFCFGLQKYEKSSIDDVVEVLHSAAVAQEEIEYQCAALESTPTLTEFTEAMIKGRPIQERIRIHQSVNKLIEQAKAKENQLTSEVELTVSKQQRSSLKTEAGSSNLRIRQSTKSNQKRKRKADYHAEHVYGSKLNYRADAERTSPKVDCGIVMNPLRHDIGWQMNFANPRLTAVPLGPPRQSQSHHCVPTVSMANTLISVGCQAPSSTATPVKQAEEKSEEKPDTPTGSIKLESPVNISSSNGTTEATVLSPGKPSSTAASTGHDDNPHGDDFQQVLDICSHTTTNNSDITFEDKQEIAITVEGEEVQSAADYQGPSFPPKPAERLSPYNMEHLTMSASELDNKLRENLEQKAMEWIHQELLVRLAAEKKRDPVSHTVNSCSMCSLSTEDLPGMHKLPIDEESECVKVLVYEEVLGLIQKVLKEKSCKKEKESLKEAEASEMDDASSNDSALCHLLTPAVTPPSTPTNLQSTTSSPDHVTLVTTPIPTPPQSPTPNIQQLVENSSMESESYRIPTPKSSSSSSNDDIDDSLIHTVQPEVVNSNLSSPSTTHLTITTTAHTPEVTSESTKKKPQTEEAVTKHAIDPTRSAESTSTSSSSSPAVSDATSSMTTATTDYDISMGEYILAKPTVIQRAKKADYSLSEGEVPLSPGDARWNALHASKLKGNLKEKKKKDITRPNHPVVEAFLDLKQAISYEKDSDSATEFSADSLQCKPQQSLSNGEIQGRSHDPFKKLLDKLNSSSSSSDSTTSAAQDEEKDNTLSEVTSFATQEDIISSPPSPAVAATDATGNKTSPGEIVRNISVLPAPPGDEPSLGEFNYSQKEAKMSRSPGEVPPILRASETRDGIDVIRISKWCDKPSGDNGQQPSAAMTSESRYLMEQFDSSEIIQMSTSRSSMNTQGYTNSSSQLQPVASHMNAHNGPTESQVLSSSPTKSSHVVEEEVNRRVVTINIPDTSAGFYSEDSSSSSNKELSTEMTFTISSLSSENF